MMEEQIAHAVGPFGPQAQGTGLGLAITQQIMEEHGGTLNVSSKENKGTTVELTLPYRRIKRGHNSIMTQKILVVDDDGSNRVTIERILNREGLGITRRLWTYRTRFFT